MAIWFIKVRYCIIMTNFKFVGVLGEWVFVCVSYRH